MSLTECVKCVGDLLGTSVDCDLCAEGEILTCPNCVYHLVQLYRSCTACVDVAIPALLAAFGVNNQMACTTTHSAKVQGAGLCCAAVQSGQLPTPAAGTTLPVYTPGSSAAVFTAGRAVMVTNAAGKCGTCMVVGSKSAKHPGRPVLKYISGGAHCPTSSTGCCALGTANQQFLLQ